jgi:hypothetical protein
LNDLLAPNNLQAGLSHFLSEVDPDQIPVLLLTTLTQAAVLANELGMDVRPIKELATRVMLEHGPGAE